MVYEAAKQFIATHPEPYVFLFDDGFEKDTSDRRDLALTGLLRCTRLSRPSNNDLKERTHIEGNVQAILDASRQQELDEQQNFLKDAPEEQFVPVANAASWVLQQWRRAAVRNTYFDVLVSIATQEAVQVIDPPEITLTLLTSAALLDATENRIRMGRKLPEWATRGVSKFGPLFAKDFIDARQSSITAVNSSTFPTLDRSTSDERRAILSRGSGDLAAHMEKLHDKTGDYADDAIKAVTGWEEEKIEAIFTEAIKSRLARKYPAQVAEDVITAFARNYDYLMDTPKLAADLGMELKRIKALFPPSYLRRIVIDSPLSDPVLKLQEILRVTRRLTNHYSLPHNIARYIAMYLPRKSEDLPKLLARERANRDPDISESLWMYLLIRNPDSPAERMAEIDRYRSTWDVVYALSLDEDKSGESNTITDRLGDYSSAPETVLFGEDKSDAAEQHVERLLAAANLTVSEKEELLTFFSTSNDQVNVHITRLLGRLQATAQSEAEQRP